MKGIEYERWMGNCFWDFDMVGLLFRLSGILDNVVFRICVPYYVNDPVFGLMFLVC